MKRLILSIFPLLFFAACQKDYSGSKRPGSDQLPENGTARHSNGKLDICHRTGNGTYSSICINTSALAAHLAHGDIQPDADGDGYTKPNPCGKGRQDDCNDANAAIHPGAVEVCGNQLDDNCDGRTDENCFATVSICGKLWMQKNLDIAYYRNGDPIPEVQDGNEWANLTTGAWCYYANNTANGVVFGKLYNWFAVSDPRGLAPAGWHVARMEEVNELAVCLGGAEVAGGKMKATGTTQAGTGFWVTPNAGASNSSGFSAQPGGFRSRSGTFQYMGPGTFENYGYWYCSSDPNAGYWYLYRLASFSEALTTSGGFMDAAAGPFWKREGYAVRCVKD